RATLDEVTERLPELAHTWQIEGDSPAVDTLSSTGGDRTDDELHARRRAVKADDVATICYTSGTTGRPKGVTLTHRNLLSEVRADIDAFPDLMESGNSLLLFLPLAHILARAIALTAFASRVTLGHTDTSDLDRKSTRLHSSHVKTSY